MSRLIRSIGLCAFISLTALPAIADQTTAPPAQPVAPATSAVVPVDHQSASSLFGVDPIMQMPAGAGRAYQR